MPHHSQIHTFSYPPRPQSCMIESSNCSLVYPKSFLERCAVFHQSNFDTFTMYNTNYSRQSDGKYCHYADGLDDCLCVQIHSRASIEDCRFYGRPVEPLAFYLPSFPNINQQKQSRLYIIPKEIRDLIFEYAFVDDGAPSFNCDNEFRRSTTGTIPRVKCGCTLLQTCKAVYLEAYRLPFLLNGT